MHDSPFNAYEVRCLCRASILLCCNIYISVSSHVASVVNLEGLCNNGASVVCISYGSPCCIICVAYNMNYICSILLVLHQGTQHHRRHWIQEGYP